MMISIIMPAIILVITPIIIVMSKLYLMLLIVMVALVGFGLGGRRIRAVPIIVAASLSTGTV